MLRKFVGAAVVLVLACGLAASDDKDKGEKKGPGKGDDKNVVRCVITHVTDTEVTAVTREGGDKRPPKDKATEKDKDGKGKGRRGTEHKYTFAKEHQIYHVMGKDKRDKASVKELQDAIEKSPGFGPEKKKGVFGRLVLNEKKHVKEVDYFTGPRPGRTKDKPKDK
jgi:hypothetical protein